MEYYIGVMSGTSLDGVDVVIVRFNDNQDDDIKVIVEYSFSKSMPKSIKDDILSICQGQQTTLSAIGDLNRRLGILYGEVINETIKQSSIVDKSLIKAIGCHGQTVWHEPPNGDGKDGFTIQLGDCNRIATITDITVVGDFRNRDISYGGQGSPLTPSFNKFALSNLNESRIILNIGGISNITILNPNTPVIGFDTGPGNILLDSWIQLKKNLPFDNNGEWAKSGTINPSLLDSLYKHSQSFLNKSYPKSTGRELFNIEWLLNVLSSFSSSSSSFSLSPDTAAAVVPKDEDVQATLLEFTCKTIIFEIKKLEIKFNKLLICGGGSQNQLIISRLESLLLEIDQTDCKILPTDNFGIKTQDMEAIAFAWFAKNTINNKPSNLISVTGASKETILGAIYLKNNN